MNATLIYVTAKDREEALNICNAVIKSRLAACANMLGGIESIYRWKGAIRHDHEVALIIKTRSDLVDRLVARIKEVHSYECPCIVALPITGGNQEFISWISNMGGE